MWSCTTSTGPNGSPAHCLYPRGWHGWKLGTLRTGLIGLQDSVNPPSPWGVIKETCEARDAHWVPHAVPGVTRAEASKPTSLPSPATPMPSQFALGKPVNGKKVAKVMRDGSKVCQAFQHGQCKNPKGSWGPTHHCPRPSSFVVWRPSQWIGCLTAVMTYLIPPAAIIA